MDEPRSIDIDTTHPAEYLQGDPSHDEHVLGKATDLHNGAAVPWWMFAKVALRLHVIVLWVARADRVASRTRRWLIAGVTIALANLGGVVLYSVHRIQEQAVAEERMVVLKQTVADDRAELLRRMAETNGVLQRQLDELKLDMRELRRALHRLSGRDPLPSKPDGDGPDSSLWTWPDKFSLLEPCELARLASTPGGEPCAPF